MTETDIMSIYKKSAYLLKLNFFISNNEEQCRRSSLFSIHPISFIFMCFISSYTLHKKEKSTYRSLRNHLIICLLIVSTWMISIDLFTAEFSFWNGIV